MGFSRQDTGVGCHFLLQGNLPDPGIEPRSPALLADALPSEPPEKPMLTEAGNNKGKRTGEMLIVNVFEKDPKRVH